MKHLATVIIPTDPAAAEAPSTKASHVADMVRAYAAVIDDGEPLDTVVIDMIADLMHYADGIPADERSDGDDGPLGEYVAERALEHYLAERDDA